MPNPKQSHLVIGYTTDKHLLLDLDNTSLPKARKLVKMIIENFPFVGNALIMLSSERKFYTMKIYHPINPVKQLTIRENYHVIFDAEHDFQKFFKIFDTLVHFGILEKDYLKIRNFRGDMTLRVSGTRRTIGYKPAPEYADYIRNKKGKKGGNGIGDYLNLYFSVNPLSF